MAKQHLLKKATIKVPEEMSPRIGKQVIESVHKGTGFDSDKL